MNQSNPLEATTPAGAPAQGSAPSDVNPGQPRTYSDKTYVVQPGHLNREDWTRWSNWIPTIDQMGAAARLNVADAVDPWERGTVTVTMRQGIGMIVLLALVAGIIPLIANLWAGLSMQTAVPLAQAANNVTPLTTAYPANSAITIIGTTVQTIAGLPPRMPGVLAGLLSALGVWINTPLNWLTFWIVYGLFVFGLARLMGASNTLEAFYAATAFVAVPLLLTGLAPIPVIGPLLAIAALVLAFTVYFKAVRYVTKLDGGRTFLCMLLPLAVGVVIPLMALLAGVLASLFPLGQPM
jgi:hypothetical protein